MSKAKETIGITYSELFNITFQALKALGGSGTIEEINDKVIEMNNFGPEITEPPHTEDGSSSYSTELEYQLAWARTYLKKYGAFDCPHRGLWCITPAFSNVESVDDSLVKETFDKTNRPKEKKKEDARNKSEEPEDLPYWKQKLSEIIHNIEPYQFEKLAQRLLRESGFVNVTVTKRTRDHGIDGFGKIKINGIISFNVAFQCKRYKGTVSADEIRDFRGALTADIEKGIFITTGTFSRDAKEEAIAKGKTLIDLIDGEELMDLLAKYSIGLKENSTYEVDEDFFENI